MNKRIRELEKQSFITTETQQISGAWDNIVEPFRYVTVTETNFSLEKFTELIVQECIELCAKEHAHSIHTHAGPWNTAIKRCKESIATHFGVEE